MSGPEGFELFGLVLLLIGLFHCYRSFLQWLIGRGKILVNPHSGERL